MTDEEIIRAFHAMWDNFPEPVSITQVSREIVAVNKVSESLGITPGMKCSQIGDPAAHRGCRLNEAVSEQKTIAVTYEVPTGKAFAFWVPIAEHPGWVLHFNVGRRAVYEELKR